MPLKVSILFNMQSQKSLSQCARACGVPFALAARQRENPQATAQEGVRVTDIALMPGARAKVTALDADGTIGVWLPRFVVDATGRDTLLAYLCARSLKLRSYRSWMLTERALGQSASVRGSPWICLSRRNGVMFGLPERIARRSCGA
jgi:hypothetical protein